MSTQSLNTQSFDQLRDSLQQVDTTTSLTGYPEHLRVAYTADTMAELRAAKEAAEADGHRVSVLELHRKDGWSIWTRRNDYSLDDDRWTKADPNGFFLTIDRTSNLMEAAFDQVCGEGIQIDDVELLMRLAKEVRELADDLPDPDDLEGDEIYLVVMDDNSRVRYTVKTGDNGYSYDTNHYCSALLIEERDAEDEQSDDVDA